MAMSLRVSLCVSRCICLCASVRLLICVLDFRFVCVSFNVSSLSVMPRAVFSNILEPGILFLFQSLSCGRLINKKEISWTLISIKIKYGAPHINKIKSRGPHVNQNEILWTSL